MSEIKTRNDTAVIYFNGLGKKYEKPTAGDFLLNGHPVKGDDNEILPEDRVVSLIKQETANFISHHFTQIVLLAGAGSSISGLLGKQKVGSSMRDLTTEVEKTLKEKKLLTLEQLADLSKYEIDDCKASDFNLEDLMSCIERAEKYISEKDKTAFDKTYEDIHKTIRVATSYEYDPNILHHDRIIKMLSDRVVAPNKLTIATTNYDTLFEDAAKAQDFSVVDGFSYDANPVFDADNFEWNLVRDIPNLATSELEYKKQVINLIKLHGSLTWERDTDGLVHRRLKTQVSQPIMIFPSSDKYLQSYTEPYFDLFSKFQELLNRPDTLLITNGFSFGDNHISQMVHHAIMHNGGLSVMITDNNITSQSSSGWLDIYNLMEARYPVIFVKSTLNSLSDYLGEVPQ
ncbi:SIR2 family protein [Oenococcus sicerae]|nr:SIR2 family protein [Oenococcus sicerae]